MNTTPDIANPRKEWGRVFWLGIVGATILFALSHFYSAVWIDEICYTDPAVNLAQGRGFISTVWGGQPVDRPFASNTPLHPWLLSLAFRVCGIHREVVQGFNVVWLLLACWLFWLASRRLQVVCTEEGRLVFFLIALLSSASYYAAGFGRYDPLGIFVCGVTAVAASIPLRWPRLAALALCGVAMPWAGLQVAAYGVAMSLLLLAALRGRNWRSVVALGVGIFVGWLALRSFFWWLGVGDLFARQTLTHCQLSGWRALTEWNVLWGGGILDPSLLVLLLVAVVLAMTGARRSWRSPVLLRAGLAIVSALWIFGAMMQAGRFPLYYAWMALLPAAVGVCAAAEMVLHHRRVVLMGIAIAALVWLPVWVVLAARMAPRRDLAAVESLVAKVARSDDVAVCDAASYYALLPRVQRVYSYAYVTDTPVSEEQKRTMTLIVARPSLAESSWQALGGMWALQREELGSMHDGPLPLNCWDYRLEVWRRQGHSPEPK